MNYREQRAYLNCEKQIFKGMGHFDIPEIAPQEIDTDGAEIIGFNYALTEKKPEDKIVHFYLDDYQFERVWSSPDRYIDLLARFRAVLSPDFSTYSDFPTAVNLFNHYRKQWLGAYWQQYGIRVVPTVSWVDEGSYEWCFDGIPHDATVSISTIGSWKNPEARGLWLKGYHEAIRRLVPKKILLIGKKFPGIEYDGDLETVESQNIKNIREKRER